MNKEKLLDSMVISDLRDYPDLLDLAQESGIEVVKEMYRKHETMDLRVPYLKNNVQLIKRYISENKQSMTIPQLSRETGWSQERVKKLISLT
jgi:surfactin synthase thioesterase subunit